MKHEEEWRKAQRLCRLSNEDIRMARELGMGPRGLIKNIPNPQQQWKAPVAVWIRNLYEKKFGRKEQLPLPPPPPRVAPIMSSRSTPREDLSDLEFRDLFDDNGPLTSDEIAEEEDLMLRRHRNFRLAADYVARALAEFEAVKKIVLLGSVAMPLEREIPRFRKFRRARQPIFHECKDVDLAVWITDLSILNSLRKARSRALAALLEEHGVGVAHHQVEVFLFSPDTNAHLGRLCIFSECPKGKRECLVPNCGAEKFLRQVEGFILRPDAISPAKTVTLFERGASTPSGPVDDSFEIPF